MVKRLPLNNLASGMRLAQSIFDNNGALRVCFGFTLGPEHIEDLNSWPVEEVDVFEKNPPWQVEETIRDTVTKAVRRDLGLMETQSIAELPKLLQDDSLRDHLEGNEVWRGVESTRNALDEVASILIRARDYSANLLASLSPELFGEPEATHSINVSILSVMLARALEFPEREVRLLATASILHDVGRYLFPHLRNVQLEHLSGPDALLMREHASLGLMLLRGSQPGSEEIQAVVLQHHESFDGSGYPQGLKGVKSPPGILRKTEPQQMNPLAEVISVANDYIARRDGTWDGTPQPPQDAITHLLTASGTLYNPYVLLELCSLVQRFPIGATVQILSTSSGRHVGFTGIVRKIGSENQNSPVSNILLTRNAKAVVIQPVEVDLSSERHVKLRLADG